MIIEFAKNCSPSTKVKSMRVYANFDFDPIYTLRHTKIGVKIRVNPAASDTKALETIIPIICNYHF
jgi:hypothetical protein